MRIAALLSLLFLAAAPPALAASPEASCEIAKNKAAGTYAACRQKAEAKAIQKGTPPVYQKCDDKFSKSWSKAEAKASKKGAACVDGLMSAYMQSLLADQSGLVATLLSGIDSQCLQPYRTLDLANRNVSAANGGVPLCDDPSGVQDVQWLGAGWYRFAPPAGTRIPETAPPEDFCGTDAPGWLNGTHPTPEEGIVTRLVCLSFGGEPCAVSGGGIPIEVVNCAGFFLYNLVDLGACNARYCAE